MAGLGERSIALCDSVICCASNDGTTTAKSGTTTMNFIFKLADIQRMIEHWLGTKPYGYIGVSYGRELQELLHKPMTEDTANKLIEWMKADMPILKQLGDADLSVVSEPIGIDKKKFYILIGEILIPIETEATNNDVEV